MRVLVLGSAAGGGVPQWNCSCPVCILAWRGDPRVPHRTQTGIAVSADDETWVLCDAAPELRQQIIDRPALHPRGPGPRHSPIGAVVLTSADVDHLAGLLCLREGHAFKLFGTASTLAQLDAGSVFDVLKPGVVERSTLRDGVSFDIAGLRITPFAVPGKVPLYREAGPVAVGQATEDVVGLEIADGSRRLCYVPGAASLPADLVSRLTHSDLFFLDGTAYTDDELPRLSLSTKTVGRMGHIAMTGAAGPLMAFGPTTKARKIFIHLNNSNPVLIEDSPERAHVVERGWDVAYDGMEIVL